MAYPSAISADWDIDYINKKIEHVNGQSTWWHVNDLYSWLQDVFDEFGQLNDQIPMKASTPTVYEWQNSWYMNSAGSGGNGYKYLSGGSIQSSDGNDLWSNLYSIGSQVAGTNTYIIQNGSKLTQWWGTNNIDILLQVKFGGAFNDGGSVRVLAREYGDNYDHNDVGLSGGGRNVVGINTANDTNSSDVASAVSAYGLIWNFGTSAFDLNNGNGAVNYSCWIDCNSLYLASAYESMKYETRRGATGQNFLLPDATSGDGEQYLAASATYTAVKVAPFGAFAGGKFFGARGVWIYNYNAADAQNFQLLDASNTTQAPPNTVAITVNSVASGDRVFVGPLVSAGGSLNETQYTISGAHVSGDTTIYTHEKIQVSSTPQTGYVRVSAADGGEGRHYYSSAYMDGTPGSFTLSASIGNGDPGAVNGYADADNIMVTFVDWEVPNAATTISNTMIQSVTVPVLIRVRRAGIIPFETESSIGTNGLNVGAIRVTDSIVNV